MTLRIHLLGPLRAFDGDQPIRLPPRARLISLWAYLLVRREVSHPRPGLAFAIWPDMPEEAARANLRRGLHRLQTVLPDQSGQPPWLLSEGDRVRWNPEADFWLDVAEFDRLFQDDQGLERARDLYTGDLLENLYEDWIFQERERLRQSYLTVLARLVQRQRMAGDFAGAIGEAERLQALEPLREDTARLVMTLRYLSGDRARALQTFDGFSRRLLHELGSRPMPETMALAELIQRNAPLPGEGPRASADRPVGAEREASARGRALVLPLVGRESELARLQRAWRRAAQGQGSLVLVGGESGIGKSRLVAELAFHAESQGGRVLFGTTAPSEPIPYQPFVEALRQAAPILVQQDLDAAWLGALRPLLPELQADLGDLPALPSLEPARERTRLFHALASCLESLARARPLLMLVEDLQWAGATTLALAEFLADRLATLPILLVATYRSEDTPLSHPLRELRRRLQRQKKLAHLMLDRLGPQEVADVVARLSGGHPAAAAWGERLFLESEGNPFFLAERLQDWIDTGQLTERDGVWEFQAAAGDAMPATVQEAIGVRLGRLTAESRTFAEVAAVAGPAFDLELVCEVSGWSEARGLLALQELLDHQLVQETGLAAGFDYGFRHHLIQEVAYGLSDPAGRTRRHLRAAQVLEGLYRANPGPQAAAIGLHYERGGEAPRAAEHYAAAAQHAADVHADEEALAHLANALRLKPGARQRFEVLRLRERISARRGMRQDQRDDLQELESLASEVGGAEFACEVILRRVLLHRALGERQAETQEIARLHELARALHNPVWDARAALAQGGLLTLTSRYEPAIERLNFAKEMFSQHGDAAGQVEAICWLADIAIQEGRLAEVSGLLAEVPPLEAGPADQSLLVQTLRAASAAAFSRQDYPASRDLGQRMLDLCLVSGDVEGAADAHLRLGATEARLFHVDAAREHYSQAEARYAAVGRRQGLGAVSMNLGVLHQWLGHYDEGQQAFRRAEEVFASLGDVRGQAISSLNLGMVSHYRGDQREARAGAQRALDLARQIGSKVLEASALTNLGAAERELNETSDAIEHMRAGVALRRELGQIPELGQDLCDLTVAYLRAGDVAAAQQCSQEMLAIHGQDPASATYPQYILWAAAQTRLAAGDRTGASELYAAACEALHKKAEAIPDEVSRKSFLSLPFNREILAVAPWPPDS